MSLHLFKNPSIQISSLGLLIILASVFGSSTSHGASLFKGEFIWKNSANKSKVQKIEIHEVEGKYAGFLSEGSHITATCSLDPMLSHSDNGPLYVELNCKSTQFETMATLVKIYPVESGYAPFMADPSHKPKAMIRFGSWVQGYKEMPLNIKMDKFFEVEKTEVASVK